MEREKIELEEDIIVDIYHDDNKEYKLLKIIAPSYISEDDSNDIDIVFKRLSDGKCFQTEIMSWGDNNYDCQSEVTEVFPTEKMVIVYE